LCDGPIERICMLCAMMGWMSSALLGRKKLYIVMPPTTPGHSGSGRGGWMRKRKRKKRSKKRKTQKGQKEDECRWMVSRAFARCQGR
jgi:hypothetical protein